MAKISIDDLKKIKERERSKMVLRDGEFRVKITVHMGTCGIAAGARDVMSVFRDLIAAKGTHDVILTNSGCAGLCSKEPMATVELSDQPPVKYVLLDREKAARIFEEHVMGGKAVEDYALARGSETTASG
ncbi:MAG: (2Fe-2S) ferredoxin domain-containing protein [Desulfomonile tiedjei]|nr:(2Fe-2S) ferredoxin domain-containing protein [Desulfomonile tiedjei]